MGCMCSKVENTEVHPNVFRVVNIDEDGRDLCSGKLEITDTDIILYREGRDCTIWPLHSLRRYGFEKKIFSFESGRRCETGEGIYAFRCQRAALLFNTLRGLIQSRNAGLDHVYPLSQPTPSPTMGHVQLHRASIDSGVLMSVNNVLPSVPSVGQSPRSPPSNEIHEVMPLYPPRPSNSNHISNVYHLRNFKEHNNNQSQEGESHVYYNDINRDLAILRRHLQHENSMNEPEMEYEPHFFENERYMNNSAAGCREPPLSPTPSNISEPYAQLTLEQEKQKPDLRLYMNIPSRPDGVSTTVQDIQKNEAGPKTPQTPKQVEYCNLSLNRPKPELNTYANLSLRETAEFMRNAKQKCLEGNSTGCLSPNEDLVNYAVLDIDANKDVMSTSRDLASPESHSCNSSRNESTASYTSQVHTRGRLISQTSLEKHPVASTSSAPHSSIGYTTIDFDKTVALTSVAATDLPRMQRHSSTASSPGATEKNK